MRGAMPTNLLEECYENGVKRLCPICIKTEPEQHYTTIDLTTTDNYLPTLPDPKPYKEEPQNESYDKDETNIEGYLSDNQPIPIESDSSGAEAFEDRLGITSHMTDVKGIQSTLIKLSNSFQQAADTYNNLATYLPSILIKDMVPLVKALPELDSMEHRLLAKAMKEHGEKYIMGFIIHKQSKQGKSSKDLERLYGVTRGYVYQARHGHCQPGGSSYRKKTKCNKVSSQTYGHDFEFVF